MSIPYEIKQGYIGHPGQLVTLRRADNKMITEGVIGWIIWILSPAPEKLVSHTSQQAQGSSSYLILKCC